MSQIITDLEKRQFRKDIPSFSTGDSVKVSIKVSEGGKERIQVFAGLVIAKRRGIGINSSFTVRKISQGLGVEKVFPLHSPKIAKIEVISQGKARRSKLYYIRNRFGKKALLVKKNNKK